MKKITITYNIPTFLIEEIELREEVDSLQNKLKSAALKLTQLKEKNREWQPMLETLTSLKKGINICHSEKPQTPVITKTDQIKNESSGFVIKSYPRKELQLLYGIPEKTFRRWLKPFEEKWKIKSIKYFSPQQVKKIVDTFGVPSKQTTG